MPKQAFGPRLKQSGPWKFRDDIIVTSGLLFARWVCTIYSDWQRVCLIKYQGW